MLSQSRLAGLGFRRALLRATVRHSFAAGGTDREPASFGKQDPLLAAVPSNTDDHPRAGGVLEDPPDSICEPGLALLSPSVLIVAPVGGAIFQGMTVPV
ncbi:MAG TPA: hypothetical protein VFC03_01485 [Acidimicrobiales bacterium]|nr:hypothetical protein [Acidimicrobiales bacterium]